MINIITRSSTNPSIHITIFFFFNDTATTEIYTLSLHDALPISKTEYAEGMWHYRDYVIDSINKDKPWDQFLTEQIDRKSTRLNSSHLVISYAVFCLKKKNIWSQYVGLTRCHV